MLPANPQAVDSGRVRLWPPPGLATGRRAHSPGLPATARATTHSGWGTSTLCSSQSVGFVWRSAHAGLGARPSAVSASRSGWSSSSCGISCFRCGASAPGVVDFRGNGGEITPGPSPAPLKAVQRPPTRREETDVAVHALPTRGEVLSTAACTTRDWS